MEKPSERKQPTCFLREELEKLSEGEERTFFFFDLRELEKQSYREEPTCFCCFREERTNFLSLAANALFD
jgi:hypothetical protein